MDFLPPAPSRSWVELVGFVGPQRAYLLRRVVKLRGLSDRGTR